MKLTKKYLQARLLVVLPTFQRMSFLENYDIPNQTNQTQQNNNIPFPFII